MKLKTFLCAQSYKVSLLLLHAKDTEEEQTAYNLNYLESWFYNDSFMLFAVLHKCLCLTVSLDML